MIRYAYAAATALLFCAPSDAAVIDLNFDVSATSLNAATDLSRGVGLLFNLAPTVINVGDTVNVNFRFAEPIPLPYGGYDIRTVLVQQDLFFPRPVSAISWQLIDPVSITPASGRFDRIGTFFAGNASGPRNGIGFLIANGGSPTSKPGLFSGVSYQIDILELSAPATLGLAYLQVVAQPVPEPETWAMMILGFGAIGAVARQRQPRKSCPPA